tara:strand:- start:83 stop:619 length:537 start_codon:yes stop_codon:yes gene_type:complete
MTKQFDHQDTEFRVIRDQFESLGFSSDLAGKLHNLMEQAHTELLTMGEAIPDEAINHFPEIVTLAKTYAAWNLRAAPVPNHIAYRTDVAANHALIDDAIHVERTQALRERLVSVKDDDDNYLSRTKQNELLRHINSLYLELETVMDRAKIRPAKVTVDDLIDDDRCEADYADEYVRNA